MRVYRSCAPVSLCADYGGKSCQSVCGLWQLYSCVKPQRGLGWECIGAVHLSVFVRTITAHAASLCMGYGNFIFGQILHEECWVEFVDLSLSLYRIMYHQCVTAMPIIMQLNCNGKSFVRGEAKKKKGTEEKEACNETSKTSRRIYSVYWPGE